MSASEPGYYNVPNQPHWGDRRVHPCGCVTHFDVALWRSVAEVRCPAHTAHTARNTAPNGEGQ